MAAHVKVNDKGGVRAAPLFGVLAAFLFGVPVVAQERPAEPSREERFDECVDRSLLDYNSCLMKSSDEFSRLICDLAFELQVARCGADAIGGIRRAWRG